MGVWWSEKREGVVFGRIVVEEGSGLENQK